MAIKAGLDEVKKSVGDGKKKVANAVTAKGVATATDSTFDTLASNIGQIVTLSSGSADATAGAAQILSGYSAYVKGAKVNGNIKSLGAQTITPGTANKTIAAGQYLSGQQTIAGDANLVAANIAKGKSIFGVAGALQSRQVISGNLTANYISLHDTTTIKEELFGTINNVAFDPQYVILQNLDDKQTAGIAQGNNTFYTQCVLMKGKYLNFGFSAYTHNSNKDTASLPCMYFTYANNTVNIYLKVAAYSSLTSQQKNWSYVII